MRSNPAVIPIAEIAERLGESPSTVYYRATTTGYVYPGVPAKRIEGIKRLFVSRDAFEAALRPATDERPMPWDGIR